RCRGLRQQAYPPKECVEQEFSELRVQGVLGTWPGRVMSGDDIQEEGQDIGPGPLGCPLQGYKALVRSS
ncbi:MAG TPA: hypothetical protein VE844_15225, partial [Gammaproteobacteria bacterium]|nr:hypothetical protein [Gammaproteobacteria bacterium]